jgi:hypothetical protein
VWKFSVIASKKEKKSVLPCSLRSMSSSTALMCKRVI